MKINNKGYASTIIMFSILTIFLISMLMLVKTMSNSSTLNKKITEKVVDNIDYDSSGSVQDKLSILENKYNIMSEKLSSLENKYDSTVMDLNNLETKYNSTVAKLNSIEDKLSNTKKEVINEVYPVGSIYMSTSDDTIEKVQSKFGGTWERITDRFLVGAGGSYSVTSTGGNKTHSHKYGMQIGAYYRSIRIENDSNAGLLNYATSNSFGLSTFGYIGAMNGESNSNAASGTKTLSASYFRAIAQTEYVSSLPPYYSVYIYRRIS